MAANTRKIDLNGEWQLFVLPEAKQEINKPADLDANLISPISACVPGNVELDLLNTGLIPDPFMGCNFQELRKFENYNWWYRRTFIFSGKSNTERYQLIISGLDTFGTVWINGKEVGSTQNMLIEHSFPVENLIEGENQIDILIESPLRQARKHQYEPSMMSWEYREEGLFIRKPPHVWGWDIMPRIVSAGIWRSIWLETIPEISIEQLYFWTVDIGPPHAVLGVWFQINTPDLDLAGYDLNFHGLCGEHEFNHNWPVEFTTGRCLIPMPDALLWWPKGYGNPNLYTIRVQLRRHGEVLDEHLEVIGLRKVTLMFSESVSTRWIPSSTHRFPDQIDVLASPDSQFLVKINRVPIMVKGTNWVPLDAYHSRDASRLDKALDLADDIGCNMIRCWGGNVYEDHPFFDYCDRHGIMVWQDFAYACCRYPQTEEFLEVVQNEAEKVVGKLRNHPSLVLWCGDNEIDMAYLTDGLSPENNRISREVLPQVLHRLDPHRPYIPSSPYISPRVYQEGASAVTPEQHLWGPRGYYKSRFYTDHTAHFIGEIGYHGCPQVASIEKFISPDKLWPFSSPNGKTLMGNDEWQAHAVYHWRDMEINRDRIKLMKNQIREMFGKIPDDLEDFVTASQICQAEAVKYFIESTRCRKWYTSGILWWNLLDGWPQFSDSVVDYYFTKKLAYHYIRRSQVPVCVFLGEPGPGKYLPVIISNDSRLPAKGAFQIWDADTSDRIYDGYYEVPANQNWQFGRIRTFAGEQRLYLIKWTQNGVSFGNHYLVGSPPIQLDLYRKWLTKIADLPTPFEIDSYIEDY